MKNHMNNQTAFAEMLRAFENDPRNPDTLYPLSRLIAFSVLRKVADPQQKITADKLNERAKGDFRKEVSNSGQNPAIIKLRQSLVADCKNLATLADATEKATKRTFTADGTPVTITADESAEKTVDALISERLGDGLDLVHTAVIALMEQAADHAEEGPGWTEKPFTVRKPDKRVYIQSAESAAWKEEETTPIQEVYRAVRRAIQNSRAIQTDPRNGYSYLEELTADPETGALEAIYIRMGKYADIGGYQRSAPHGLAGAPADVELSGADRYTTDRQSVESYNSMLEKLEPTPRQSEIIRLRMQGNGYKAIATKLGVTQAAVNIQLYRLREKAVKMGMGPDVETIADNLVRLLFRALEK